MELIRGGIEVVASMRSQKRHSPINMTMRLRKAYHGFGLETATFNYGMHYLACFHYSKK